MGWCLPRSAPWLLPLVVSAMSLSTCTGSSSPPNASMDPGCDPAPMTDAPQDSHLSSPTETGPLPSDIREAEALEVPHADPSPDAPPPDPQTPDATGPDPMDISPDDPSEERLCLLSLTPDRAGASVGTMVTLRGTGFGPGLEMLLGDLPVPVTVLGGHRAEAFLPPVEPRDVGPRAVTLRLGPETVVLPDAFTYEFDEDPIVFVHGFMGTAEKDFGAMRRWFLDQGYPESHLWAIDYRDNTGANHPQARDELAPFVQRVLAATGADRVDLVAHSMGALSTRLYIRFYGGEHTVRDYVSTCGAHHGTSPSCLSPWWPGAVDLCPAYGAAEEPVTGELNGDPDFDDIDETPFGVEDGGPIAWHSIYSTGDLVIVPWDSSCLDQRYRGDCSSPINVPLSRLSHNEVPHDEGVFRLVWDFVRARNRNKP